MSVRIRFNAEPHHVLKVSDDQEIWGGKEGDVPDDVAKGLAAADWADVTIVKQPTSSGAAPDPKEKK